MYSKDLCGDEVSTLVAYNVVSEQASKSNSTVNPRNTMQHVISVSSSHLFRRAAEVKLLSRVWLHDQLLSRKRVTFKNCPRKHLKEDEKSV